MAKNKLKNKKVKPKIQPDKYMKAVDTVAAVLENQTKLAKQLMELGIPLTKMKDLHELQAELFGEYFDGIDKWPGEIRKFKYKK